MSAYLGSTQRYLCNRRKRKRDSRMQEKENGWDDDRSGDGCGGTRFSSTQTGGNLFGCRMAKLGEFLGITPREVKEHMWVLPGLKVEKGFRKSAFPQCWQFLSLGTQLLCPAQHTPHKTSLSQAMSLHSIHMSHWLTSTIAVPKVKKVYTACHPHR